MSLSSKQQKVLDFIRQYSRDQGYPPSVREICEGLSLKSTSTAHGYLERLERKGYIRRDPSRPRAIELLDERDMKREVMQVPLIGQVSAGEPIFAQENIEDYLHLPSNFFHCSEGNTFMLRIQGQSMINAGILDDDLIVVERCQVAENGEIVVALVGDNATCKRFYKEKDHIRLQPENDAMEPIREPSVEILGKVVGLVRQY